MPVGVGWEEGVPVKVAAALPEGRALGLADALPLADEEGEALRDGFDDALPLGDAAALEEGVCVASADCEGKALALAD